MMFCWVHKKRYQRYEHALEDLEAAVAADKRAVLESDKESADKAIKKQKGPPRYQDLGDPRASWALVISQGPVSRDGRVLKPENAKIGRPHIICSFRPIVLGDLSFNE